MVRSRIRSRNSGVIGFWWWFGLASILTAMTAVSNPLMQTMSMEPMGKVAGMASSIIGAFTFAFGAVLAGMIDRLIDDTVTPFGVGYLVYGTIAFIAVLAARPTRASHPVGWKVRARLGP